MTITMGQLVSELYEAYDRELGDRQLAAVATQVHIAELRVPRRRARSVSRRAARDS